MTTQHDQVLDAFEARAQRRSDRRAFFTAALGAAAVGGAFAFADPAKAQATVTDPDVLNFALNLEYLESQFYSYAVNGSGLPADQTTSGSGAAGGTVTGGRKVDFTGEPLIRDLAVEIAADEAAHVKFLRTALGSAAIAMPNINISGDASGAFTAAARAAGVVGPNDTFDPYSSPDFFLLAGYLFEDVGVTAYKGAAPLLTNATFLEAAAGLLAVEAYHGAILRTMLYERGQDTELLITAANKISDARDMLDGKPTADYVRGVAPNDDQGIVVDGQANIVPLNRNGLAYSRTTGQVLNIVYLNPNAVSMGGFFPNGVNGAIVTSAASA